MDQPTTTPAPVADENAAQVTPTAVSTAETNVAATTTTATTTAEETTTAPSGAAALAGLVGANPFLAPHQPRPPAVYAGGADHNAVGSPKKHSTTTNNTNNANNSAIAAPNTNNNTTNNNTVSHHLLAGLTVNQQQQHQQQFNNNNLPTIPNFIMAGAPTTSAMTGAAPYPLSSGGVAAAAAAVNFSHHSAAATTNNNNTTNNANTSNKGPMLPPFLSITAAEAAKITLTPNDCHRLGVFPYFKECCNGMFLRVKTSGAATAATNGGGGDSAARSSSQGEEQHAWVRIVAGITADDLAELGLVGAIGGGDGNTAAVSYSLLDDHATERAARGAPSAASHVATSWVSLPSHWKRRVVNEPVYEWREKRYELHLICEHPFAKSINKNFAPSATMARVEGGEEETTAEAEADSNVSSTFVVTFRQLAKEHAPTQAEVDAYCVQFVPIKPTTPVPAAAALSTTTATTAINGGLPTLNAAAGLFATAEQSDPLAYVPFSFKSTFMTPPPQSERELELERLEARIKDRMGKGGDKKKAGGGKFVSSGPNVPPAMTVDANGFPIPVAAAAVDVAPAVVPLPHETVVANVASKLSAAFEKNVIHRALSKEDAGKVVAANTRLNNVAGNAVIRGSVLYNVNLSRASQIEAARRSMEFSQSQQVKAAQKALSRAALVNTNNNAGGFGGGESLSQSQQFPAATQMGTASQNADDESVVTAGGDVFSSAAPLAAAPSSSSALDIESLLVAALGPAATPTQIEELRETLLSQQPSSSAAAPSVAPKSAQQSMMMLLTTEELQALSRDDSQFNAYLNNADRRKALDCLASVTIRNTQTNIGLRLQGHRLMEIRDMEREAHDDTMQTMWVTDADARRKEADHYISLKAGEGKSKDGGKTGPKAKAGPRVLTEEEEIEMYANEAKLANNTFLSRQGSTLMASSAQSSATSSLARPSQHSSSSAALLGDSDDIDDLLSFSQRVRASASADSSVPTAAVPLVRAGSVLSAEQRAAVSQSLGRVPIVAAGLKRDRD